MLPKTADRSLVPRTKLLFDSTDDSSLLYRLEKAALIELIDDMNKDALFQYYEFLHDRVSNNKSPSSLELFETCWLRLVGFVMKDLNMSLQKQAIVLTVIRAKDDYTKSDLFPCLISGDVLTLFNHAYDCEAVPDCMQVLDADAICLAERINSFDVLPEAIGFLEEKDVINRLKSLLIEVPVEFEKLKKRHSDLKAQWTSFLSSLYIMKECDQFAKKATEQYEKHSTQYKTLENTVIRQWTAPTCHPHLKQVSERLVSLKGSVLFNHVWSDPSLGLSVASDENKDLTNRWVEYFEVYFKAWQSLIQQIDDGSAVLSVVQQIFRKTFHQLGSGSRGKLLTSSEAEVRQELEKLTKTAKEELEALLYYELEVAVDLFNAEVQKVNLTQKIFDCILATAIAEDIAALKNLHINLNIFVAPCIENFCTLFSDPNTRGQTPYGKVVVAYTDLVNFLPTLKHLIRGFTSLFFNVMFQQDLLKALGAFQDVASLNSRIDNRQGEDIRPETHDILHALRLLCDPESILQHRVFAKIRSKLSINSDELLNFFVACGGAVVALAMLQDKLKKGGLQAITDALQSDSEEKQTIAIVKNLLVNGGIFMIEVKDGKVSVSTTYKDPSRPQLDAILISPEELEALPSQLLLTSGVATKNQTSYDVDAPLPENIARLEDRECYVLRFNKLFDTAFQLSEVVRKLCKSGNPDYQEKTFSFECHLRVTELLEFVSSREELLLKWKNTFEVCRSIHPILSFLARSQLVSCLSALRTNNIDLLFSTLQSIGCDPFAMNGSLHATMEEAKNLNKAHDLFNTLAECLVAYFGYELLNHPSPGSKNLPDLSNPFAGVSEQYGLILIPTENHPEEVVGGAHILMHKRLPRPIEILFCNAHTTEVDVEDFLDRWALFTRVADTAGLKAGEPVVTFWLVGIEDLTYPTQTRCMQKLFKMVETLPKDHPKLFFVMRGEEKTYISTVLKKHLSPTLEVCQQLSSLIQPIAAALKNIFVVHSKNCGDGKTTSIIRNLVCDKKANGRPVLHAQFSVDTTPMDVLLKRLLGARPMTSQQGLILHFNVGHQVNAKDVNLFLFQYLLISSWRDGSGFTFPRHRNDTIVIELCNTGKEDERDRITICKYFQELPLETGISYVKMYPHQSRASELFYSWEARPANHEIGTQVLVAVYEAMRRGAEALCSWYEVVGIPLPSEDLLKTIVSSLASENLCPKRHLMACCAMEGNHSCSKCNVPINIQDSHCYCNACNVALCCNCMKQIPVEKKSENQFLRRYFWFMVMQLQNFYVAFQAYWQQASWDQETGHFMVKFAYHYCRIIINCAKNLSKPAMSPFDERRPLDDVQRCSNMDKFENWRDTPFLIVTPEGFHVTSTSKFSPLAYIKNNEPRTPETKPFLDWVDDNETLCGPVTRNHLQQLCLQLSQQAYSIDQKKPPLKTLIEVLGCDEGAKTLLYALDNLNEMKGVGARSLSEADIIERNAISDSVKFLKSIGCLPDCNVTCTEFMGICTSYLNSLFGNDAEKPRYTLTADNILRIMAVQMRLISGIPVCIMGETGCGKTETLHFLSKISASDFEVINVQEGMMEKDFYRLMQPIAKKAELHPDRKIVVVLDELNATSALWTAKDMLCDHICFGVRLPENVTFVVILNPWKVRSPLQEAAIAEMDVGGLDFLKYQQNANKLEDQTKKKAINLVYQVHRSPETLYSLVWDWGSSSTTLTPLEEIRKILQHTMLVKGREFITDELIMASSMVSWLIRRLENVQELRGNFKKAHDNSEGEAYWLAFRTLLVELLLESQHFLRHDVYLDEISVVSLRDMRKACELIGLIFIEFWVEVRSKLQSQQLNSNFPYFDFLMNAVHVALVNTYCLRLDTKRRLSYLVRIQSRWAVVRGWFSDLPNDFMCSPPPASLAATYDECEMYQSFNELATYIIKDLDIDSGIAVNQALKENTFAVLCAVCTNSTLFIVGRPGSTKSRTLELLVKATEENRGNTFLGRLGIVIQKHVIQCSPYTTAHHVHSNARRAAMAQIAAEKIVHAKFRRINVIVLEEVGATIGSVHNPLMSLHSMIDHGIEIDGKRVRLPIIGVSNYRLDASKMGRGRVVYRGNPPVNDLEITARAILRGLGEAMAGQADWISRFSLAFSGNILCNEAYTWYYGMRDFYATVSSIRLLAVPLELSLQIQQLSRSSRSVINSHITRWAVLINLRGFPDKKEERKLAEDMQKSFGLSNDVLAKWEWKSHADADSVMLCDCCCRMQMYRETLSWQAAHPNEELTDTILANRFRECATPVIIQSYCKYFENASDALPAAEIISYSLREVTSRHVMIFTKANAALLLLFSMGIVRKDQCTVIFQSTASKDHTTTASELVQQMMRIKACMREGKTLILVKSRHIYESMLDPLNVHYTKDRSGSESDNLHKTMLSMAGVTQSVFVQPSFRCIVLEDQEELKSYVLPPMINRFSKTVLTYASALNPVQSKTRTVLFQKCNVQIDMNETINILKFLIPGLSEESLDSAVYAFSDLDEIVRRLCYCFSRKNLRRLCLRLVEGLNSPYVALAVSSWHQSWKLNQCNTSFETIAEYALYDRQHLMVITEQLQLNASSLAKTFQKIFTTHNKIMSVSMIPDQMTILNQATSGDVYTALNSLKRAPLEDNTSALGVFILDTTSSSQSVQLDSFMYAVSSEALNDRQHVILIVVVSDFVQSKTKPNFSIVFDPFWAQLFADEVCPRTMSDGTLLPCSMLNELEKDVLLHELFKSELIMALALENDNLTTLCQSLYSSASSVRQNLDIIRKLLTCESPLRSCIFKTFIEHTRQAEITFEKWSKLAFQKAKYSSDSLRATYLDYLGAYVVRVFLQLIGNLMQFDSMELVAKADLMDIITNLMKSESIFPVCDIEECLNLAPFAFTRTTDVESSRGFFYFPKNSRVDPGKPTKVSFPLSPFVVKHIFNLGFEVTAIEEFVKSVNLEEIQPICIDAYISDAMCLGTIVSPTRLPLFKKIVQIFYPDAFNTITNFHIFVAQHSEWSKSAMKFCMDDFSAAAVSAFEGKSLADLVELAAVDGVVPLRRVDILSTITRNDENIDWRLIRAMSMIDAIEGRSMEEQAQEKVIMKKLYDTFQVSEADGIVGLFQAAPYHFIKFFLFEIFSDKQTKEETIAAVLSILAKKDDLSVLLGTNEGLKCGIAFLLRKAISILLQKDQPKGELAEAISAFFLAGVPYYVISAHCASDIIFGENIVGNLDSNFIKKYDDDSELCRFIRVSLAISVLIEIGETDEETAISYHDLFDQLIQASKDDIREATLFVIRSLSSGGTIDAEKALATTRSNKYPPCIRTNVVIDEVSRALQKVNPLACNTGFANAIAALSEYAVIKNNDNLKRYKAIETSGKIACIASHCVGVAPQVIAGFSADIYPVLMSDIPAPASTVLGKLNNCQELRTKSEKLRELVLALILAIFNGNKPLSFHKQMVEDIEAAKAQIHQHRLEIEELMVPKCPRCKIGFAGFRACWAVECNCGCSFCAHCMLDCGGDAHPHLIQVHGNYWGGSEEQWKREFGALAANRIRNYLKTVSAQLKPLLEAELPRIITGNAFFVHPEQILNGPVAGANRAPDVSPIVAVMLDILSCAGSLWSRIVSENTEAESLATGLTTLEANIQQVQNLMFPNGTSDSSAFSWIHAMIWKLGDLDAVHNRKVVQDRISFLCREYSDPLTLLGEFDRKCRSHLSGILGELQASEKQLLQAPFDSSLRRTLLALPRTVFNFEHQFWSHLRANYDAYSVLNLIGEKETSLNPDIVSANLKVIQFLHLLQLAATEKKMTRAAASVYGSLLKFIKDYGEPLSSAFVEFKENFVKVFHKAKQWECNDKMHNTYANFLNGVPDDAKLEAFLPSKQGVGILSMSLWGGFESNEADAWVAPPIVQNMLFRRIHTDKIGVAGSPYYLTEKDVVTVNYQDIFDLVNDLFVVPGYQPRLSDDLHVIEGLCKYGAPKLASFPCLDELPVYNYGLEGISDLFAQIQNRFEHGRNFTTLPAALSNAIKALILRVPYAADLIFSYCGAVSVQQAGDDVIIGKEVWNIKVEDHMPLTEEQQQGKQTLFELPTAIKSFCVEHLPAMMGLCWNCKNLHETANVELEDADEIAAIAATFQKMVNRKFGNMIEKPEYHRQIPAILASLRAAGFSLFSAELSEEFANAPLRYYLTTISIPLLDDDNVDPDGLQDNPPFTTPAKHFGHVLKEAEGILGPDESSTPVLDGPLVPWSAVRPLLQSTVVEESKPAFASPTRTTTTTTTTTTTMTTMTTITTSAVQPTQRLRNAQIRISSSSPIGELEL